MDESAVVLNGPKSTIAADGYQRDGRKGDLQVQFIVAIPSQLGIPAYVKPFVGIYPTRNSTRKPCRR